MDIKEAAIKYGVSRQAIYQRLKSNGIPVDNLKDKESGHLTPEAEAILDKLFGPSREEFKQRRESLQAELTAAKQEIESQRAQIELLTVKLQSAEKERDLLRETLDQERILFNRFLPAPAADPQPGQEPRKGLFKRIAAAIKG